MLRRSRIVALLSLLACNAETSAGSGEPDGEGGVAEVLVLADTAEDASTDGADGGGDVAVVPPQIATLSHSFGAFTVGAYGEAQPCVAWTLENEQPLYVEAVTLANDGGFHHSNWFVVPEDSFPSPDGFFNCKDSNFAEISAAIEGTVIFAQSTQSLPETQRLPPGVVVKIPPRHKIVGSAHVLNLSSDPLNSGLRMALEIIHPKDVKDITAPFRLTYYDLHVDPKSEQRFGSDCDFAKAFETGGGAPLDLKIYWVLPHYHYLGNYFQVAILGGPNDGQVLHELGEFDGEANGKSFEPAIDLTGAKGLRFTCGYRNPRDVEVGWGIGDQEMCVMLGLASSRLMMDASVGEGKTDAVGEQDGKTRKSGPCNVLGIPKNKSQVAPTAEELAADLYVPLEKATDRGVVAVKECVDTPADAEPTAAATLASVRDTIFLPGCSYNACHGGPKPAAGLHLDATDLHAELMSHVVTANTDMPLIDPGNPEGSWLYHLISRCDPVDAAGAPVALMPRNAPFVLDPGLVARVRDWIQAGAKAD